MIKFSSITFHSLSIRNCSNLSSPSAQHLSQHTESQSNISKAHLSQEWKSWKIQVNVPLKKEVHEPWLSNGSFSIPGSWLSNDSVYPALSMGEQWSQNSLITMHPLIRPNTYCLTSIFTWWGKRHIYIESELELVVWKSISGWLWSWFSGIYLKYWWVPGSQSAS